MKSSILFFLNVLAVSFVHGQAFINTEWDLSNGNPLDETDRVVCALDPNGNLVLITNNVTGTNADIFLNCIHPGGGVAWEQTCPSSITEDDFGIDLAIDPAGNIYVAGAKHNGTNYDFSIAKYTPGGALIWEQTYNGSENGDDVPSAIVLDDLGNVLVTGSTTTSDMTDYVTIKYNNSGVQQWMKFYDFSNKVEVAADIVVDNAGNVVVCGASAQTWFNSDFALRKYSPSGTVLATKRHNTPGNG